MLLTPSTFTGISTGIVTIFLAVISWSVCVNILPPLRPGLPAYIVEFAGTCIMLPHGTSALTNGYTGAEEMSIMQTTTGCAQRIAVVAEVAGPEPLQREPRWKTRWFEGRSRSKRCGGDAPRVRRCDRTCRRKRSGRDSKIRGFQRCEFGGEGDHLWRREINQGSRQTS